MSYQIKVTKKGNIYRMGYSKNGKDYWIECEDYAIEPAIPRLKKVMYELICINESNWESKEVEFITQ